MYVLLILSFFCFSRLRLQQGRRPPVSPIARPRRVPPNFAAASTSGGPAPCPPARAPSRTRSLDLLDRECSPELGAEEAVVSACEQYLSAAELRTQPPHPPQPSSSSSVQPTPCKRASILNRAHSCDEARERSTSVLSLTSAASEPKRKRNFMDRCVNKVRSLIRK